MGSIVARCRSIDTNDKAALRYMEARVQRAAFGFLKDKEFAKEIKMDRNLNATEIICVLKNAKEQFANEVSIIRKCQILLAYLCFLPHNIGNDMCLSHCLDLVKMIELCKCDSIDLVDYVFVSDGFFSESKSNYIFEVCQSLNFEDVAFFLRSMLKLKMKYRINYSVVFLICHIMYVFYFLNELNDRKYPSLLSLFECEGKDAIECVDIEKFFLFAK